MSSNEQQNAEQAGGWGFNPFGFAFGGAQHAQDMRSFDEILKEYENFFAMEESNDSKLAGIKGRDITVQVELEFGQTVSGCARKLSFARK